MWNKPSHRNSSSGFTLIETVITILLLGTLSVVSLTVMNAFRMKAEQSMMVSTELLDASSCIERIKAVSQVSSMEDLIGQRSKFESTCRSNPKITLNHVDVTTSTDSSGNITTIATVTNGACTKDSALCVATVKINSTELRYVFTSHP